MSRASRPPSLLSRFRRKPKPPVVIPSAEGTPSAYVYDKQPGETHEKAMQIREAFFRGTH